MARIRSVTYEAMTLVPAADVSVITLDGLLRDILPDRGFRIHSIDLTLSSAIEVGDTAAVSLAKNVSPLPTALAEGVGVAHGILAYFSLSHVAAAAVVESASHFLPFPEPLDFDQNDSLNLRLGAANAAATPQEVMTYVTISYSVG